MRLFRQRKPPCPDCGLAHPHDRCPLLSWSTRAQANVRRQYEKGEPLPGKVHPMRLDQLQTLFKAINTEGYED